MSEELPQILLNIVRPILGHSALPGELAWLLVLLAGALILFLMLRLANWQLRRSFEAVGRLSGIEVDLTSSSTSVEVEYEFRFRGRMYTGTGTIPLIAFGPSPIWLGPHPVLDVAVLRLGDEVYVGGEAIEHVLMQWRHTIPIRFLSADPTHNAPRIDTLMPAPNDFLAS